MVHDSKFTVRNEKRVNRRSYRRMLDRITRSFVVDPERFDSEPFNVKRYTGWDIS